SWRSERPAEVPLWKVMVGPRADKLKTGPARARFFLWSPSNCAMFPNRAATKTAIARPAILLDTVSQGPPSGPRNRGRTTMCQRFAAVALSTATAIGLALAAAPGVAQQQPAQAPVVG